MIYDVLRWYSCLRFLGVAVHELAHAVVVKLCGGKIISLDLTSHVAHRGSYTRLQQLAISYAPLVVNSGLSIGAAKAAMGVPNSGFAGNLAAQIDGIVPEPILVVILQMILLMIAFSLASAALPSYEDAWNPYRRFRQQIIPRSITQLLWLPLSVFLLLVFLVPLGFTYLRSKSQNLRLITEIVFTVLLILQATGIIVVIEASSVWNIVVRTIESAARFK
jgi:hypothetical protein